MTNTVNIELELSNNHFDEFSKHLVFWGGGVGSEIKLISHKSEHKYLFQ